MAKKWVGRAFGANPGALHRDTGTPLGEKIPERKMVRAEHSRNPKTRARARLAETARSFNHGRR